MPFSERDLNLLKYNVSRAHLADIVLNLQTYELSTLTRGLVLKDLASKGKDPEGLLDAEHIRTAQERLMVLKK